MNADMARAMWERALGEEIGLAIQINEPDRTRIKDLLYKVKTEQRDPRYEAITVIQPKRDPPEIWLVKKAVELDP